MDSKTHQQLMIALGVGGALALVYYLYMKSKKDASDAAAKAAALAASLPGTIDYNVAASDPALQSAPARTAFNPRTVAQAPADQTGPSLSQRSQMLMPSWRTQQPNAVADAVQEASAWTQQQLAFAQQALAAAGIQVAATEASIVAALVAFQKSMGLATTGTLDAATALQLSLKSLGG
jgi:hypothetical protein